MKTKVKRFTDLLLEDYSENEKRRLISLIDAVIKSIPKFFRGSIFMDRSFGICSVIEYFFGKYGEKIREDLRSIIMENGVSWKMGSNGWEKVEDLDWGFVWKPGSIRPRVKFLKELKAYIENEI